MVDSSDCAVQKGADWFRYRAGALIIENGEILFAWNRREGFYYTVGGGVHLGEDAEQAVIRETYEETGVRYETDRLAFIHEYFFKGAGSAAGLNCQELTFYYLMKPKGCKPVMKHDSYSGDVPETMCWLPVEKLNEYPGYPRLVARMLKEMDTGLKYYRTREHA